MVVFSRMNHILELDFDNERAVVEAGVVNFDITLAVQDRGYFFDPDPSSQRLARSAATWRERRRAAHSRLRHHDQPHTGSRSRAARR